MCTNSHFHFFFCCQFQQLWTRSRQVLHDMDWISCHISTQGWILKNVESCQKLQIYITHTHKDWYSCLQFFIIFSISPSRSLLLNFFLLLSIQASSAFTLIYVFLSSWSFCCSRAIRCVPSNSGSIRMTAWQYAIY